MFFYRVCGLSIQSEIELPELVTSLPVQADVCIKRGELQRPDPASNYGFHFHCDAQQVLFDWQQVGAFALKGNREILVHSNPDASESLVRLPLLGTVFATLLHQRGFLVLHGSAVVINGRAIAFIGEKGMGKSTTTVTLHKRGHRPITDDIVAIDCRNPAESLIYPSFPQLKLWPDAALSVGEDPNDMPEVADGIIKRAYPLGDDFSLEPVPLKAIYVLSFGDTAIRLLTPQEALMQLITHSYCARFGSQLLQGKAAKEHLQQCANLMKQIDIRQLDRLRSLESLPDALHLLEKDVADMTS